MNGISWSPDNRSFLTGSGASSIWSLGNAKPLRTLQFDESVWLTTGWSPDEKQVALANGGILRIYDAESGEVVITHTLDHESAARATFSGYSWDREWSPTENLLAAGREHVILVSAGAEAQLEVLEFSDSTRVRHVAFSPDGRYLAAIGQYLGPVPWWHERRPSCIVWDLETREVLRTWLDEEESALALAIGPDSRTIAIRTSEGHVHFHNVVSGEQIRTMQNVGTGPPTHGDRFTSDLQTLITAVPDSRIRLWNLTDGSLRGTLLPGSVTGISPDGHCCGSNKAHDEVVYVVETESGQQTMTPFEFANEYGIVNDPSRVSFSSDAEASE